MSAGGVSGWVVRRLPAADGDHRAEMAASVSGVVAEQPRCDRAREAASLVGLGLTLWGRREGGDDARRAVRQGLYLGGIVVALMAAARAWTEAEILAALLLSLAAALASGGWRVGALAAAIGAAATAGFPLALGPAASAVAVAAGERFGARRCWRGLAAGVGAAAVVAFVAATVPSATVTTALVVALVAVPLGFLAVGWFDPRFAVAATVAWLGAFIAVDVGPRPLALAAAVVLAAHVSASALRRAFAA